MPTCFECHRPYETSAYYSWCDSCGERIEKESFGTGMSYAAMINSTIEGGERDGTRTCVLVVRKGISWHTR